MRAEVRYASWGMEEKPEIIEGITIGKLCALMENEKMGICIEWSNGEKLEVTLRDSRIE